jgi:hypothetical protein
VARGGVIMAEQWIKRFKHRPFIEESITFSAGENI